MLIASREVEFNRIGNERVFGVESIRLDSLIQDALVV